MLNSENIVKKQQKERIDLKLFNLVSDRALQFTDTFLRLLETPPFVLHLSNALVMDVFNNNPERVRDFIDDYPKLLIMCYAA